MRNELNNEPEFVIYSNNNDNEISAFSRRNQTVLSLVPELAETIDSTFLQIKPSTKVQLVIYMLSRLCVRHYEAIFLLCTNGLGFSGQRILRSMFEKCIDALYLNKHPNEIEDFTEYHFVQMEKLGFADIAKKIDANFESIIEKFRIKPTKKQLRLNWSKKSLVAKAIEMGADDWMIKYAYNLPNRFVHSSLAEILDSVILEDEKITPVETDNNTERMFGDLCFNMSIHLVLNDLRLQLDCFDIPSRSKVENLEIKFNNAFISKK